MNHDTDEVNKELMPFIRDGYKVASFIIRYLTMCDFSKKAITPQFYFPRSSTYQTSTKNRSRKMILQSKYNLSSKKKKTGHNVQ